MSMRSGGMQSVDHRLLILFDLRLSVSLFELLDYAGAKKRKEHIIRINWITTFHTEFNY